MASHTISCKATSSAPWKALLRKSLAQNSSLPYAKYLQLATVRPDGRPANRTVVFRGFFYDTDHITIVTDRRSNKVVDLASNPNVELCWYFPSSREQYRISGIMDIITENHADQQLLHARQEAWARMSDAGRSQFGWPHPGQPRMPYDEALFLQPAPESAGPAAANFCLGIVQVHEVDHVDLYTNQRHVYTSQQEAVTAAVAGPAASECGATAISGAQGNGATAPAQILRWTQRSINP